MNNYKKILEILKKSNTPVSAKKLAESLSVSDRSIRNYIKTLRNYGEKIIADENGYMLEVPEKKPESTAEAGLFSFAVSEDRVNYIIEKIILINSGIDLYDLADSIYISYSTIEKDIIRVKKKIALFNLRLERKNGIVKIVGNESDKRSLISHYLSSNSAASMELTVESLCSILKISQTFIQSAISAALKNEQLYASDYALKSILIHVIINLARIKISQHVLDKPLYAALSFGSAEYNCAKAIYEKIAEQCTININEFEIQQLAFIITAKTSNINFNQTINLSTIVDSKIIHFVNEIIQTVNDIYYIDLNDENFISFFTLHLSNMLFRCEHNVSFTTPLSDEIFIQNPLIYDVAVYITQQIRKIFGYRLSRDEITFISLHVGAVLEKKIDESNMLKAIMVANNYYNYCSHYSLNALNQKLSGSCQILDVVNDMNDVNPIYYDLIIDTTASGCLNRCLPMVQTHTIITDKDFKKVRSFCEKLLLENKKQDFKEKLQSFIEPCLFERNHYESSVEKMIQYMSQKIIGMGFAPEEFTASVLEREAVTPTSFDNKVAIPHSIVCSTTKNICFIIINEKPMKWELFDVQLILMIGVNHNQRKDFKYIYSNLLERFEDPNIVKKLVAAHDYHEFIEILTN